MRYSLWFIALFFSSQVVAHGDVFGRLFTTPE